MTVVVAAALGRRPALFVFGVALVAGSLSASADAAYVPVTTSTLDEAMVRVVGDPRTVGVGVRVDAAIIDTGQRVELTGYGSVGARLASMTIGQRWSVDGGLRPVDHEWFRVRHVVGRVAVESADHVADAGPLRAGVEWIRQRVILGGEVLSADQRPLYRGLVIGDDRDQPPAQRIRFRQSGLAHLLAVSGQNVAFALAVTRPLVRRLPPPTRTAISVVVLLVFAAATRFEPSVLRASATAGLAVWSTEAARRQRGTHTLSIAVALLLMIDPFLADAVGFRLSVAASFGILLLGPAIRSRLRGPAVIAEPLSVTLAAQLAVAPLLLSAFGPVSLISIPANLAAGWAAGLVMVAGLSTGVMAGALGPPLAPVVQWPVAALLWWIDVVARIAVEVPAPSVGGAAWLVIASLAVGWWMLGPTPARWLVGVAIAVAAATTVPRPPSDPTVLPGAGQWWPATPETPSVLVVGDRPDLDLAATIVERRLRPDLLVVTGDGRSVGRSAIRAVVDLADPHLLLAPPMHHIVGARRLVARVVVEVGDGRWLVIEPDGGRRLEVTVTGALPGSGG